MSHARFQVMEATIEQLREALQTRLVTSEQLVRSYLERIEAYDIAGPKLRSVVVRNARALDEARESDRRRAAGHSRGSLDGIPYTAKDSYMVEGMTVAAGSPAFEHLRASSDAFVISRLRESGAVLLGLTNMPPMAAGGMQRGVYGRAESPYNQDYLTSAFGSGSSNGSGSATAASLAAFGLAEETWSSGRAPASYNSLCAYTPSWGVISMRGNWSLTPTMDVAVPHTRTMGDLLEVLDVIVADDHEHRGDFWRMQPWLDVPRAEAVRPESYVALGASDPSSVLAGKRFGVPRMYINADRNAGTSQDPGIGGSTGRRIDTRASVIARWVEARAALLACGAEVVEVDFPVVSNFEGDRPGAPKITTRGLVPPGYLWAEKVELAAWAWDDFLAANADPALHDLTHVDGSTIFPHEPGTLPGRYDGFVGDVSTFPDIVRARGRRPFTEIAHLAEGVRGLERTRRRDLEQWMDELRLDAVVFPAVADVGRANMDRDLRSADEGWRNGVWVANGNLVLRQLGIPTVTVPMGLMDDLGMPIGLTFAGRAYDDVALLELATAFDATGDRRTAPPLTPPL